ncbi:orotidine-5'-phosphate decarboxylase [Alphaproteobacteria bacterium]|nr:orotidine-5'-phosphate decarboxylase [Alphaproteobacteria bacterium]
MKYKAPIYVSIDTTDIKKSIEISISLKDLIAGIKIGKEFFTKHGPQGIKKITDNTKIPFFLDLKFHDIPNTVEKAIKSACEMNPSILNIHVSGGSKMIKSAVNAVRNLSPSKKRPLLVGVTILTSLIDDDLREIGFKSNLSDSALKLATLAKKNGLDGVVCSPHEIKKIRKECGPKFKLITPGIRLKNDNKHDQRRIMTPAEALSNGADILVIGRSITNSKNPIETTKKILNSLN